MTLLSFVFVEDGAVAALDTSPQLCNPSASYGAVDLDTGDVAVNAATEFDADGSAWSYDITDDGTVQYRYYVKAIAGGVTYYLPRTTAYIKSACLVLGRYTNSVQIESQFGVENVHKWLAIDDRDEAVDYAFRYYEFIRDAEAEIDDALRDGGVEVPMTTIPVIVKRLAAQLAGIRAYEARGVIDVDGQGGAAHRLSFQLRWCYDMLRRIRAGLLRLEVDDAQRYPEINVEDVVVDDDDGSVPDNTYSY